MIPITDLRCGNYVSMGSDRWWIVAQVNSGFIKSENPNDEENCGNLRPEDYFGILIRKELLLEKCGFALDADKSLCALQIHKNICIVYDGENSIFYLGIIDDEDNQTTIPYPHIQHIHQLQNLYYSLSGKEMPIKL